jgi:hypothetical protein
MQAAVYRSAVFLLSVLCYGVFLLVFPLRDGATRVQTVMDPGRAD